MIRRPPRSTLFPYTTLSVVAVSLDRKSTRLNSSHTIISYAVFCLKKKTHQAVRPRALPTRPASPHGDAPRARTTRAAKRGSREAFCLYLGSTTMCFIFFFNDTATTEIYTLSLHDALPI